MAGDNKDISTALLERTGIEIRSRSRSRTVISEPNKLRSQALGAKRTEERGGGESEVN